MGYLYLKLFLNIFVFWKIWIQRLVNRQEVENHLIRIGSTGVGSRRNGDWSSSELGSAWKAYQRSKAIRIQYLVAGLCPS